MGHCVLSGTRRIGSDGKVIHLSSTGCLNRSNSDDMGWYTKVNYCVDRVSHRTINNECIPHCVKCSQKFEYDLNLPAIHIHQSLDFTLKPLSVTNESVGSQTAYTGHMDQNSSAHVVRRSRLQTDAVCCNGSEL